jgi:O-antigen/teichoic acid export membrane protein
MINKLKPKSDFSRNVLTLMTGTTIAQAIPIAISPILTRIYSPEDFGIFALYMSIVSIIATMATGRYELAIMLPKKDEDTLNIMALSIIIVFFVSFLTFLIVFFFNAQITDFLGNTAISYWLYLVPISVLLTGVYQSLNYWFNRKKVYKTLAKNRIIQSSTTSITNLSLGFAGVGSSGLILSSVFGQGVVTALLSKFFFKNNSFFQKVNKINYWH